MGGTCSTHEGGGKAAQGKVEGAGRGRLQLRRVRRGKKEIRRTSKDENAVL